MKCLCALTFGLVLGLATPAAAEVRFGVAVQNVSFEDNGAQADELGSNLELEAVGAPLRIGWARNPRPYAMVSASSNGGTSFAAAGLYWSIPVSENWRIEPGVGLAIHNGELHNPQPPGALAASRSAKRDQTLGSRMLFRDSIGLRRELRNGASIGITFEHLSNGGELLGHRDNQSLNQVSIWYAHRFR